MNRGARQRRRATQRGQINTRTLRPGELGGEGPRQDAGPRLYDAPRIESRHSDWWQVHRVELDAERGEQRVLIAELRDEEAAFRFISTQAHCCILTKFRDRRPPHRSYRPVLVRGGSE